MTKINPNDVAAPVTVDGDPGRNLFWAGAILSFLVSLVLYVKTMAASASFWDAGEFIAAAYNLGIPHSPGTPLYVLVGKVFSLLPIWFLSIAERVNLLSAFCGAVGALFVYLLIVRFLDQILGKSQSSVDTVIKVAGGLVGAFFITFSDTYWNNAIEAEVYAMSTALMGFMTWLVLKWEDNPGSERSTFLVYLMFYLLALSVGFHLGTILVFSGIFLVIFFTKDKTFSNFEFIVPCIGVGIFIADATLYRNGQLTLFFLAAYSLILIWVSASRSPFALVCSLLFVLGISVHLFLLIRSGHNPSLDEGDPETWRNLYAVLRREQYPDMNVTRRKADFWFQLQHFNGYFQAQFQMVSAYVSKLNLGALFPIALGIWGMVDQWVKNRKNFIMLFTTLVVMSLGLIIFLNFSDNEVRERDYFYSPAFYYFAIYIGVGAGSLIGEVRNLISRQGSVGIVYGVAAILVALPFLTMKHHYFTHDRSNNYTCPVYARNMLIGLERDAVLFTHGDNDTFPLWYIQEVEGYRTDIKVVNLSLLNTPWYIKQCRDNEPKVPIVWNDDQINALRPHLTADNRVVMVRDQAVNHIIRSNKWQKPVYFSVTIPPDVYEPYRDFMEMEGLAYKVVPRQEKNMVNVEKLRDNIYNNFEYTNILDENFEPDNSVYLPPHTEHLIQNYAAAFIQLAFIEHRDSLYESAARNLEIAHNISPQMEAPVQMLGWYYYDAGKPERAVEFYERMIEEHPDRPEIRFRLAGVLERLGQMERAIQLIDELIDIDPSNKDIVLTGVSLAIREDDLSSARRFLEAYLRVNPRDTQVRGMLDDLKGNRVSPPVDSAGAAN